MSEIWWLQKKNILIVQKCILFNQKFKKVLDLKYVFAIFEFSKFGLENSVKWLYHLHQILYKIYTLFLP